MEPKVVEKLPSAAPVIGAREVQKGIRSKEIKRVIVAKNCPEWLIKRVEHTNIERFAGDERELGTALGKPFAVAIVGYKE